MKMANNDYDVVIDALQTKRDRLMEITMRNMKSDFIGMGIMDDIRLKQCAELDRAIEMWKEHNGK
jgi:hypothetical protein